MKSGKKSSITTLACPSYCCSWTYNSVFVVHQSYKLTTRNVTGKPSRLRIIASNTTFGNEANKKDDDAALLHTTDVVGGVGISMQCKSNNLFHKDQDKTVLWSNALREHPRVVLFVRPIGKPPYVSVTSIADTRAQSNVWILNHWLSLGFDQINLQRQT